VFRTVVTAPEGLAECCDPLDIVEIVDPLQHHALHAGGLQLAELCRNLFGGAYDLALRTKLVGALAPQALGKLLIIATKNNPRHQRAADIARRPSLLAQQIIEQSSALPETVRGEVDTVPLVREACRQRQRAAAPVATDDDWKRSLTHRIGHKLSTVKLVELSEERDRPLLPQETGYDLQRFREALKTSIETEQVETPLLVFALHPPRPQPEPEPARSDAVDCGGLPCGDPRIAK
jgi:5-formyltetrahydrofolate cyclo-ligase